MRRLRIAMISEQAGPLLTSDDVADGDAAYAHTVRLAGLSAALARRGHEVHVYARNDSPDLPTEPVPVNGYVVQPVPAGPAGDVDGDEFGRTLEKRFGGPDGLPDVIHAPASPLGLAAVAVSRHANRPLVVGYQGAVDQEPNQDPLAAAAASDPLVNELASATVAGVITGCGDDFKDLVRQGVPRSKIVRVPAGVDTDEFRPDGPVSPFGARGKRRGPRILGVGRLANGQGFAHLVHALAHVPRAELVIAGGAPGNRLDKDPFGDRLRAYAQEMGVADRVRLIGAVPRREMARLYRSVDVLACAPRHEPHGIIPLEAMACGLPVVAYAVGCLKETVIDDVTGVLVAPGDVRAMARSLRRLLADDVRRMTYSSAAVDRARSRYQWSRLAEEVERVYAGAIGERPDTDPVDEPDED